MGDEESPTAVPHTSSDQLGPLARRLLAVPEVVTHVVLPGLFQCLSVPDSQASLKAVELVWPTLQAVSGSLICSQRAAGLEPRIAKCLLFVCSALSD